MSAEPELKARAEGTPDSAADPTPDSDPAPAPDTDNSLPRTLRVRYRKLGKIRFTSQRDVARMWERALRRSGLPVAWSEGFSPHPLLSFSLALPTGSESMAEYLDIRLDLDVDRAPMDLPGPQYPPENPFPPGRTPLTLLPARLSPLLPEGIDVDSVGAVAVESGSLQQEVTSCSWNVEVLGVTMVELAERVERLLDAPSVPVTRVRKGRLQRDDLRPAVRSLVAEQLTTGTPTVQGRALRLTAELATRPRGVRPGELLQGLGTDLVLARACRTNQWIERDGVRWEPLPPGGLVPGADAPHAIERAS